MESDHWIYLIVGAVTVYIVYRRWRAVDVSTLLTGLVFMGVLIPVVWVPTWYFMRWTRHSSLSVEELRNKRVHKVLTCEEYKPCASESTLKQCPVKVYKVVEIEDRFGGIFESDDWFTRFFDGEYGVSMGEGESRLFFYLHEDEDPSSFDHLKVGEPITIRGWYGHHDMPQLLDAVLMHPK